jgi:hypothetical protein
MSWPTLWSTMTMTTTIGIYLYTLFEPTGQAYSTPNCGILDYHRDQTRGAT